MKNPTIKQVDDILRDTEQELSTFENSVRIPLNSQLSDNIHTAFDILFEPKSFALSLFSALAFFYISFFANLLSGDSQNPQIILILTIILYIIARITKFIKNKIR